MVAIVFKGEIREMASTLADRLQYSSPEEAAEAMQTLIADVIASLIDAGSERDAVMENETLRQALEEEFRGWVTPYGWRAPMLSE